MNKDIPDLSQTPRDKVPLKYQWNLEDIFPSFKAWETGREKLKQEISQLTKWSKGWTDDGKNMEKFLSRYTRVSRLAENLYVYSCLLNDCDMNNKQYQKMKGEIKNLLVNLQTKMAFFNQDILKLGEQKFSAYQRTNTALNDWDYKIREIFRMREHTLPKDRQKIVSLTGLYSHTFGETSEVLNNVDMPFARIKLSSGKIVELNYQALVLHRRSAIRKDRTKAMRSFFKNQKKYENTFALLINGEINKHLFYKNVYNYKHCLMAKLYPENIDSQVYQNLILSVKENLAPLQEYLKIKRKLLQQKELKYEDLYASSIKSVEKFFSFQEAKDLIKNSLKPLGKKYLSVIEEAFSRHWIDIYSNKGKQSGAYCNSIYGIHPYIKLNYNGTYNSVSTTAHELGHALHSYFSNQNQPYEKADYSIFTAEIASTFNEILLVEYMLRTETNDLIKIALIDNFIEQLRGTIYRQTLFAEYELKLHQKVEEGQPLTADWLNETYLALTREYYGHDRKVVKVDQYIESEWSVIPHFFFNFYVYTYSTGIIAAMALSEKMLAGNSLVEPQFYLNFLSEGGCRSPLEILKTAGVDMRSAEPYVFAFQKLKRLVKQMQELQIKLKNKK